MPISNQQGDPETHTFTLKVVPGFTYFQGSPKSIATVKVASNAQHYNPAPLVLSVNSYRIIVQGCTPNVHLIPSGNANDQNKSISDLPFSVTESLRNPVTLSCSHSPSKFYWHPHSDQSIPWQGFLTSEDTKTKAYPCLKTIILVIACSWKSMDTIRYECPIMTLFLNALLTYRCTLQFLLLLQILAINFNHLTGCFMHSCTKHINSIRFKIN